MIGHDQNMLAAIRLARWAAGRGERPFGCVIVDEYGDIIGAGSGSETATDPTRHSEITAIRMACADRGDLLRGCTLYSTHEPCAMCCGAISHSKVSVVVYGSARNDLPTLFRSRSHEGLSLLADTSHPPLVERALAVECVSLFDGEVAKRRQEGARRAMG